MASIFQPVYDQEYYQGTPQHNMYKKINYFVKKQKGQG
jgi:hypothetical protein